MTWLQPELPLSLNKDSEDTVAPQVAYRRVYGTSLERCNTLENEIGWNYNAVLTSVTVRVRDDIWTAIIKADHGNAPMVAFLNVGSFARCVEVCCEYASKGQLSWKPDKYPPRTRTYSRPR